MSFSISNKIRELCEENEISISTLERNLEFSAGLISRWDKNSPSIDKITQVADYFSVSIDSLIGRGVIEDSNSIEVQFTKKLISDTKKYNLQWKECMIFPHNNVAQLLQGSGKESLGAKSIYVCICNGMSVWLLEDYDESFFLYTTIEGEVFVISCDSKMLGKLAKAIEYTGASSKIRDIAISKMKDYIKSSGKKQ